MVVQLERDHPPAAELRRADVITDGLVIAALSGERVMSLKEDKPHQALTLLTLAAEDRAFLAASFSLASQQVRGAWFLPEEESVTAGLANLPHYFSRYPRFAIGAAYSEGGKVDFRSSPESLYFWAVLEPLFSTLFLPLALRGPAPAKGDPTEQKSTWEEVRASYVALGLDVENALAAFRYDGGWGRLTSSEQLAARTGLLEELRKQAHAEIAARFRIWRAQELLEKYYAKAKRSKPEMRKVLTKPLQRTLAGSFMGDWSLFIRYLGEDLAPAEQIPTSLPETRISVSLAADDPIQRRLSVLRSFWREFDSVHSDQAPGKSSLWGFVEESESFSLPEVDGTRPGPEWFEPGSYRERLSEDMLSSITELWDGSFLPRFPEAIVTSVNPYARMCDTFGTALRFWHGAALTAWFVSEGPYSRTDMRGLARYYERDLKEMQDSGCPVDPALFDELLAAEEKLAKPEPFERPRKDDEISVGGITINLSVSVGSRRSGFERLRDVLTRYRRIWADRYLDTYLRARWESELRGASQEYGKLVNVKGKPPTLKQFAKFAEAATNHWFGGDVRQLYTALGKECPSLPARVRLLVRPLRDLAYQVFTALGGKPTRWEDLAATIRANDREKQDAAWRKHGTAGSWRNSASGMSRSGRRWVGRRH